jgi:undecaprenol kinase
MASNAKKKRIPILKSFYFAIYGIGTAIRQERNIRIHLVISMLVLTFSFYFSLTEAEWLIVLIAIGGMLSLELVNTAIERVVDLATAEFHPLAKQAKDLAAGAVLIYAVISVIVGLIIFIPRILSIL